MTDEVIGLKTKKSPIYLPSDHKTHPNFELIFLSKKGVSMARKIR